MFDRSSRYDSVETAQWTLTELDGTQRIIAYKRRRFIPPASDSLLLVEHGVAEGERLDHITARYLDDPTQFWQVCDANNILRPVELEEVGRVVKIALPQG